MKHETNQLGNLLTNVPTYHLEDFGLDFKPKRSMDKAVEYMLFVSREFSRVKLSLTKGTIFKLATPKALKCNLLHLIISGDNKSGNLVIFIDCTVLDMERKFYQQYPNHIDVIRSLKFSEHMTPYLRGMVGQLYHGYKEIVNEVIRDGYLSELEEISFIGLLHEFMLSGQVIKMEHFR